MLLEAAIRLFRYLTGEESSSGLGDPRPLSCLTPLTSLLADRACRPAGADGQGTAPGNPFAAQFQAFGLGRARLGVAKGKCLLNEQGG